MSNGKEYCPIHTEVQAKILAIQAKQESRPCQTNTEKISTLEKDSINQWLTINQLRRIVYMGAGAAGVFAFLGSILGAVLKK